ncbi:MAG: PTS sugar transporter subunit IIB [Enterobacteriaceae bacterium]
MTTPNIVMTRIDNRLVHGQVGVTWLSALGANLLLVAEMMLEREGLSASEFRDQALVCGRRGLTSLWHEQQRRQHSCCATDEEGI